MSPVRRFPRLPSASPLPTQVPALLCTFPSRIPLPVGHRCLPDGLTFRIQLPAPPAWARPLLGLPQPRCPGVRKAVCTLGPCHPGARSPRAGCLICPPLWLGSQHRVGLWPVPAARQEERGEAAPGLGAAWAGEPSRQEQSQWEAQRWPVCGGRRRRARAEWAGGCSGAWGWTLSQTTVRGPHCDSSDLWGRRRPWALRPSAPQKALSGNLTARRRCTERLARGAIAGHGEGAIPRRATRRQPALFVAASRTSSRADGAPSVGSGALHPPEGETLGPRKAKWMV